MLYRILIPLIKCIHKPLTHPFCYLYTLLFCRLKHLVSTKASIPLYPVNVMGLDFSNPIGLAAGFDKQGDLLPYCHQLNFGFIEMGTVNIKSDYNALNVRQNLLKATRNHRGLAKTQQWGVNLGSLRNSLDQLSISDYQRGMSLFWNHADYLVINLSRPGSPVRDFKPDMLEIDHFLNEIKQHHTLLKSVNHRYVPITVKLAIDYHNNEAIPELLLLIQNYQFDGVVLAFEHWPNGQSVISQLQILKSQIRLLPFIVVGGIRTINDAKQVLATGADLVQLYTSLVEHGPSYINQAIEELQ